MARHGGQSRQARDPIGLGAGVAVALHRWMRAIVLLAIAACVERVPTARLPRLLYPTLESDGRRSYPTLEPDARIDPLRDARPIDPYGPEAVLRRVVGDHVPSDVALGDPGRVTKMLVDVKSSYALPNNPNHHIVVDRGASPDAADRCRRVVDPTSVPRSDVRRRNRSCAGRRAGDVDLPAHDVRPRRRDRRVDGADAREW